MNNYPEQYRDPNLATNEPGLIGFYPREFYPLDNFSAFQVEIDRRVWPTAEHAYHAMKFIRTAPDVANQIADARSPHDAFKIAHEHENLKPERWDNDKLEIMEIICRMKLDQHPYLAQKLLETDNLQIVEDSPKDSFWGWGEDRDGRNELGQIWMKLRNELKASSVEPEPH